MDEIVALVDARAGRPARAPLRQARGGCLTTAIACSAQRGVLQPEIVDAQNEIFQLRLDPDHHPDNFRFWTANAPANGLAPESASMTILASDRMRRVGGRL
jgi:hypothetical protein